MTRLPRRPAVVALALAATLIAALGTLAPTALAAPAAANAAPECRPQTVAAAPGGSRVIVLPCTDADYDYLLPKVGERAEHGTVELADRGFRAVRYTPDPGFTGTDHFTFAAADEHAQSAPAVMTVEVESGQHAPACVPKRLVVVKGASAGLGLADVCHDPDFADAVSLELVDEPLAGTVIAYADSLEYRAAGRTGADHFTVRATDGVRTSAPVEIQVDVIDRPEAECLAEEDPIPVRRDGERRVPITCLVAPLPQRVTGAWFEEVDPPAHGTLRDHNAPLLYEPDPGYTGPDEVKLRIGGPESSNVVTIRFDVSADGNLPPECLSERPLAARAGQPVDAVLGCIDPDGDPVTYAVADPQPAGTFVPGGEGGTYTAPSGANAPSRDRVNLVATDGHGGQTPTALAVRILPAGQNTPPVCFPVAHATVAGRAVENGGQCFDEDGDPLTLVFSGAQGGTAKTGFDTWVWEFTPAAGFTGAGRFSLAATDGTATSAPVDVRVRVAPNGPPRCTFGDEHTLRPGRTIYLGGVCLTDDGYAYMQPELVDGPDHGKLVPEGNGYFDYTPDPGYKGPDSVTLRAANAYGAHVVTVRLTVDPDANELPYCWDDTTAVTRQAPLALQLGCADPDGDTLTYEVVEGPAHGTLTGFDSATGTATYTPDAGFVGIDTLRVRASDARGRGEVATQRVTVRAADRNIAPSCGSGGEAWYQVEGNKVELIPVACDDPDRDPVTISIAQAPTTGGTVTLSEDQTRLIYTPTPTTFRGVVEFTVVASDGRATSKPLKYHVDVWGTRQAPACTSLAREVPHGQPVTLQLSCTKWGPYGKPIELQLADPPAHGTLSALGDDGTVTYTPAAGYGGADAFTYRATDEELVGEKATVTLTVGAAPDPGPDPDPEPDPGPDPGPGGEQPKPDGPSGPSGPTGPSGPSGPSQPDGPSTPSGPSQPGDSAAGPGAQPQAPGATNPRPVASGSDVVRQAPSLESFTLTAPRGAVRLRGTPKLLTVACAAGPCQVAAKPVLVLRGTRGKAVRVALRTQRLRLAAGRSGTVTLRLTAAQRRRLRAARTASVRLAVAVRDGAGTTTVRTLTVRLRLR